MKISDATTHDAIVARNAAIVATERGRKRRVEGQLSWNARSQSLRFRDTVLSAEPTARNPDMMGKAWVGNLKAELAGMSVKDRKAALDVMRQVLDGFESSTGGPAGSFSAGADPAEINDAMRAHWDDVAKRNMTRDRAPPRDVTQAGIKDVQRANDEYWHRATAHQRTPAREYGKG
jgi:hypothetical protein